MPYLAYLFLWAAGVLAQADSAPSVFQQDPLCDRSVDFPKALKGAQSIHRAYPFFASSVKDQNRWFLAVTTSMQKSCEADRRFAEEINKRDRSARNGQCGPAAEVALYDEELLRHSEESLKEVVGRKEEFLTKGAPGVEPLWSVFTKNFDQVEEHAFGKFKAPWAAGCELRWLYPLAFLERKFPIEGCPPAPPGVDLPEEDRQDPGVFAQLMTRFSRSVVYNTQRRDRALVAAKASRSAYESCIAKNPGEQNVLLNGASAGAYSGLGQGGKVSAPVEGRRRGSSDISGTKENEERKRPLR